MVFFSYLQLLLSLPFLSVLTGSEGGRPCYFILHVSPFHPIHLRLPLPHNIRPTCTHLSLPPHIPLPHHVFPPSAPLSLPLPLPHHLRLPLPRHIRPLCVPLSISLPLYLFQSHLIYPGVFFVVDNIQA